MTQESGMSRICGFILAAGEGRRLRPATLTRPKALVPFCGVPLLELVASSLVEQGISQIVVNACYQADRLYEACARLRMANGWDLRVSLEPQLLNQGGGLRKDVPRQLPQGAGGAGQQLIPHVFRQSRPVGEDHGGAAGAQVQAGAVRSHVVRPGGGGSGLSGRIFIFGGLPDRRSFRPRGGSGILRFGQSCRGGSFGRENGRLPRFSR